MTHFSRRSDVQLRRSAADFSEIVQGFGGISPTRLHGCINASIACQVRFAVGRPKSEMDGRKSMAAQPFILTIDGVRPFCYKIRLIVSRRITMRAPFQILAIPYRIVDGTPMYCVFHRADHDQWQFIAGGGEDNETPLAAAKRETFEEGGVHSIQWLGLKSLSYVPVTIISEMRRKHWDSSTYVIPEYTFGFECQNDVRLSPEHTDCVWLT